MQNQKEDVLYVCIKSCIQYSTTMNYNIGTVSIL